MLPDDIEMIRQIMPDDMTFNYYADRESPWLLAQMMRAPAMRVADLRAGPAAKLLTRPLVRPVVAACGGTLARAELLATAHADRAQTPSAAGLAGSTQAFGQPWQDFGLSFDAWGTKPDRDVQMSRQGGNLVLQLGFPSDHAALLGQCLPHGQRDKFEFGGHPIRQRGRPTLAWARLDLDLDAGACLIEEVQCDWLRYASRHVARLARRAPQTRQFRVHQAYEQGLIARYAKGWPATLMLAVLMVLREEFGIRTVWMHQPQTGVALKGIYGTAPPRSLYTALPKAFCFAPTRKAPAFLERPCRKRLKRLRQETGPLFWKLVL